MQLNEAGRMVSALWDSLPARFLDISRVFPSDTAYMKKKIVATLR